MSIATDVRVKRLEARVAELEARIAAIDERFNTPDPPPIPPRETLTVKAKGFLRP